MALGPVAAWQMPGAQGTFAWVGQLPLPLQNSTGVATPALQLGARHCVVAPGSAQAAMFVPSQKPWHADVSPVHFSRDPCGTLSVAGTGEQIPGLPGTSQA